MVFNKSERVPKMKTKVLRWGRIVLPQEEKKPSVWDNVVEIRVDEEQVSTMFAIKKPVKSIGGGAAAAAAGGEKKAESQKPVRVLPDKRFNAISILRTQLPQGNQLSEIIMKFDRTRLQPSAVANLYKSLLTEEEIASIQEVMGPGVTLDKAEQFGMMVAEIPCIAQRLHCWTFMNDFDERVEDIGPALTIVQKACKELRESGVLRGFLGVVLTLGNILNAGNKNLGQADGFNLETFKAITDMHDTANKTTMLDVALGYCKGSLIEEIPHIGEATGVDLKYVQGCFGKLNTEFQSVSKDYELLASQLPPDDPTVTFVGKFVKEKTEEVSNLKCEVQDTAKMFTETVEWFTMDPSKSSTYTTDSFFGIFKGLADAFTRKAKAAAGAAGRRDRGATYGKKLGAGDDPMADIIAKIKAGQAKKMNLSNVGQN